MALVVPSGSKVVIKQGTSAITGKELLLENDLTLSLQSNFAPLVDSQSNNWLTAIGQISNDLTGFGFSGQFKQMGFQIWQTTQPLAISLTVGLYRRTDAYADVVYPAKQLMKLPLPGEGPAGNLQPPGPSLLDALAESSDVTTGKNISVRIGRLLHLKRVLISKVEPTFSSKTDENGNPIWIKLTMDISTLFTATSPMIDGSVGA